jgi:hypothetical protein
MLDSTTLNSPAAAVVSGASSRTTSHRFIIALSPNQLLPRKRRPQFARLFAGDAVLSWRLSQK